jgi:uncharacterized protein (UPF0303 family)
VTTLPELIAELHQQEQRLQFTRFTHADAWDLGRSLVEMAIERDHGVTIDITKGDQQLFHAALSGTTPDNDDWVARKTRTVRRFGHSSFLIGRKYAEANTDLNTATGLPLALYSDHGGCFPILVRDVGPVGTVTVSGLAQHVDHALVVEALELALTR